MKKLPASRIRIICDNCGEKRQLIRFYAWVKQKKIQYKCEACGLESVFDLVTIKNV